MIEGDESFLNDLFWVTLDDLNLFVLNFKKSDYFSVHPKENADK